MSPIHGRIYWKDHGNDEWWPTVHLHSKLVGQPHFSTISPLLGSASDTTVDVTVYKLLGSLYGVKW